MDPTYYLLRIIIIDIEGADVCGRRDDQRSLESVGVRLPFMHESALHDGFLFWHHLVAVTAFEAFLMFVTFVITLLHAPEIPDDSEVAHCDHEVSLQLPTLRHL